MANRLWILGASDPEMAAIERLLNEAGERVAYATVAGGRVHPGNAYKADGLSWPDGETDASNTGGVAIMVECGGDDLPLAWADEAVYIDHHRPGDPGYGRPPEEFFGASSIGQVVALTGREVQNARLIAAADHCLEAAYRGRCPGIDPDDLMRWRVECRAAFQKLPVEAVLANVEAARLLLRGEEETWGDLPASWGDDPLGVPVRLVVPAAQPARRLKPMSMTLHDARAAGCIVVDLRGRQVPELPEAAAREGIPFLATVRDRNGRGKVVLQAASPELVRRFLAGEIVAGLKDMYGDPMRGIAGGYL